MIPPSEWDVSEKVLGGGAGLFGVLYMLQKMMTFWKIERKDQAAAGANETQFITLSNQIKQQDERIAAQDAKIALMAQELQRQDGVIHKQQTKLTRTEMLVRQFVGLVKERGIEVPNHMQEELDDLIKPDRDPTAKTRASDKEAA